MRSSSVLGSLVLVSFAFGSAACTGKVTPVAHPADEVFESRLTPLSSCADVQNLLRQAALEDMNRRLDELETSFESQNGRCYATDSMAPTAAAAGGGTANKSSGPSQVSGTNNQVAAVDEADFVKNDGHFIYAVVGNKLEIVEAWPANAMHKVSEVLLPGEAKKLFIDGDRAIVYSSVAPVTSPPSSYGGGPYDGYARSECKYGYNCEVLPDGTRTEVSVFDVTNRAAPTKVREVSLSSSLIAARKIGHAIHTVVSEFPSTIPGLKYSSDALSQFSCSQPTLSELFTIRQEIAALRSKNTTIIQAFDFNQALPQIKDTAAASPGSCGGFYRPSIKDSAAFTSVISFDATNAAPVVSATIVGRPGHVYASENSLYFAASFEKSPGGWFGGSMASEPEASTVHKFHVGKNPGETSYAASGIVKGHVLNQFSMDEWNGDLRVATSSGHVPDPNVHSTVSVLHPLGDALYVRGSVDHLAPKEDIRSVRFAEERVFIVTFKKTDPLYVLDASNPSAPVVQGELKIPGFSTYMHMMDSTHLLTIGYDAEDHDTFAFFQGVLLQIFDVSNPENPTLLHKERIGTRGSSSEALADHLAFNYFAPKNLLAIPMTICENSSGGSSYGTNMTFSGLMVYDTTVQNGFNLRGKVAHPQTSSGGYNNAACSNWWSEASSEVKRSIFMDDFVYSISEKRIKVNSLANLNQDIAVVPLAP